MRATLGFVHSLYPFNFELAYTICHSESNILEEVERYRGAGWVALGAGGEPIDPSLRHRVFRGGGGKNKTPRG
jgi:hypothetical protein